MDKLVIAGREFESRLLVGTGKFASNQHMAEAIKASSAEIVTVALRRVDIENDQDAMLRVIDRDRTLLLPNTSGARDAQEAIRLARLARAATGIEWLKLEVTPNPYHLLPDPIETLRAAEVLVKEGFVVLPYINADPVLAGHLEECGVATVMPLASPIGSNQGLKTRTRPMRWRWGPTPCWSTRPLPRPRTRWEWRWHSSWPSRRGAGAFARAVKGPDIRRRRPAR